LAEVVWSNLSLSTSSAAADRDGPRSGGGGVKKRPGACRKRISFWQPFFPLARCPLEFDRHRSDSLPAFEEMPL